VKLTRGEIIGNSYKTDSFEAWSHVVKGFSLLDRGTVGDILKARKHFEQAVNLDPDYAYAWTLLAWTYAHASRWSESPGESIKRSFDLAQKAAALGENQAGIHSLMNRIYRLQGKYDEAIAEGKKSVALAPNSARSHIFLAASLHYGGRPEEAIVHAKKAMRLEPYYPAWFLSNLAGPYEMVGRYEEANAIWKKFLERALRGEFPPLYVHERLVIGYAGLGRMEEAQAHATEILKIKPDYTVGFYRKTRSYKDKAYLENSVALLRKAGLPEHPPLPLPDKPSIAVLAFDNMSGDPEQEYFSDGITEDIITALSKTPKMFVIARNSSFTYKGKPVKVQEVGRDLGVRYVLEGSVRKVGKEVRITAQLIDAKTGHHLWAEKYDRELKDIFALQDEITKRIIAALEVKLTEGEQAALHAKGTDNLEVYLKCLEARELIRHHNIEDNRKARRLLVKAIEIDPDYAQAYRWLSSSHFMDVLLGMSKSPGDSFKRAIELSKKALSIDNSLAGAHGTLGYIYVIIAKQYEKGMAELEMAVELEPNGADVHGYLGTGLLYTDKLDEAILIMKKAIRLNPIAPSWYLNLLAALYRSKGNYKEALVWSEKAVKQEPENTIARVNLSSIYYLSGRIEEAHLQASEVMKLNPKFSLKRLERTLGYKNPEVKKQYIDALRNTGLPE
jgi:TolB-like protein/Tfp pilus assembly protein PilF